MDSKVKERIIGAAVLVALGVWLFPWVLNGSDPAATAPNPFAEVELLPAAGTSAVRTETVELDQVPTRIDEPEPETEPPPPVAVITSTNSEPPVEIAAASPAVAAPTAAAPPATVGWSVQIGSFGEVGNAQRLASRAAEYGYEAQVSDYRNDGRIMHRVRVGGFASRDAADAAASSLSAHGFVPRVFPPAE